MNSIGKGIVYLMVVVTVSACHSMSWGETAIYGQSQFYSGDTNSSFRGSTAYGLGFTNAFGQSLIAPVLGADFLYGPVSAYIDDESYSATLTSADLSLGLQFSLRGSRFVGPVVQAMGVGGIRSVHLANPLDNTKNPSLGFAFGYRVGIGVDLRLGSDYRLRGMVSYIGSRASKVSTQSSFDMSGILLSLGLAF